MSIGLAIVAEEAEDKRKEWVYRLQEGSRRADWGIIERVIAEMDKYYFSE